MSVHLNDGDYAPVEYDSLDETVFDLVGVGEPVMLYEGDRYYHIFSTAKYTEVHKSKDEGGWHSLSMYYKDIISIQTNPAMKNTDGKIRPGLTLCFRSGDCLEITVETWQEAVDIMRFVESHMF